VALERDGSDRTVAEESWHSSGCGRDALWHGTTTRKLNWCMGSGTFHYQPPGLDFVDVVLLFTRK
jgi:hypothetical protein